MRRSLPLAARAFQLLTVTLFFCTDVRAAITVTFSAQSLHVSGITPHGDVAIAGILREAGNYRSIKVGELSARVSDSSGGGAVDYDLGRAIPQWSVWAVVDLASGAYVLVTPPGYTRNDLPVAGPVGSNGAIDQVAAGHLVLDILWVRPGSNPGAWFARASDGGANDSDGSNNGKTLVAPASFAALSGAAQGPPLLAGGDVVALFDPLEMQAAVVVVTP
jgi:hypothetical protein